MDNENKRPETKLSLRERLQNRVGKGNKSPWNTLKGYLIDTRAEVKKVIWPTRTQLINNTGIVLIAIAIIGIFIWALDVGLTLGVRGVSGLLGANTNNQLTVDNAVPADFNLDDYEIVYDEDGNIESVAPKSDATTDESDATTDEVDTTDAADTTENTDTDEATPAE